jgi:hypothetical protein
MVPGEHQPRQIDVLEEALLSRGSSTESKAFLLGVSRAGTIMTWSRVCATPRGILVMNNRPHRANRSNIAVIDICRSNLGHVKQVVPIVRLKHGASLKLLPLCLSSGERIAPQFEEQRREMLVRQQSLVDELRSVLGVGGSDYSGE